MSHWFKSGNNATEMQSVTNSVGSLGSIISPALSANTSDISVLMEQYGSVLKKLDEVRTQQIKALAVMLSLDADSDGTPEDAMQRARDIVQNYESSLHRFSVTNYEEYKNVREGIRKNALEASNMWTDYMGTVGQQIADMFAHIQGNLAGSSKGGTKDFASVKDAIEETERKIRDLKMEQARFNAMCYLKDNM
jgi:hypothetical protein